MNAPLRHRPTSAPLASSVELRLRCLAPRIHALGEGPLFYLLREIAGGANVVDAAERYARLPADLIRAYRGDRLPPALAVVRRPS
jgi:hypothetical protein